jgi:putative nucleotidyltransferase with HDIG domain
VWAAIFAASIHAVRRRSKPYKLLFNAAAFAIAAGIGTEVYRHAPVSGTPSSLVLPSLVAGAAFWLVNIGLLTAVMSSSQDVPMWRLYNERFRWLTFYYLAFGPLACACTIAYTRVGLIGLFAFALPPALMIVSMQQYIRKTRAAVDEIERANAELRRSNSDLRDLFDFAAGLAAQRHDSRSIAEYAQEMLGQLLGGRVEIRGGTGPGTGTPLTSAGRVVGDLVVEGGDEERWLRLQDAIEPQLATALDSAILAEEARRTHLATIAALSRSLEAKDTYTGGHTERVAEVAVALARRLGFDGADLDAIEIGALLHDVGKIGIPEGILHKPGPLDADEWTVMKRHPVVSEFILSGADLPRIVLQIARSSHERIDGLGYPDGLGGDTIPLPARIVLVADAYDALTSDRPYRAARRPRAAIEEIVANAGTQFCPLVVGALEQIAWHEPAILGDGARLAVVA